MEARPTTVQHASRLVVNAVPVFVALLVMAVLAAGWLERNEEHITPDAGPGYWLGIAGGSAMLLLLLYPLRKRSRHLSAIGSVPFWFRMHMWLGVIGPVLVVFHANFKLGSVNSNVAFFAMLIVALSGVVGRYLYGKIHLGLYGRKAEVKDIIADVSELKAQIRESLGFAEPVLAQLDVFNREFEERPEPGLLASLVAGGKLAFSTRVARIRLTGEARRLIRQEAAARGWSSSERRQKLAWIAAIIRLYFRSVLNAAEFVFYERLFALWHLLHLPLFFLMVIASAVHVWAVHRY